MDSSRLPAGFLYAPGEPKPNRYNFGMRSQIAFPLLVVVSIVLLVACGEKASPTSPLATPVVTKGDQIATPVTQLAIINTSLIEAAIDHGQGAEFTVRLQQRVVLTEMLLVFTSAGLVDCDTSESKKKSTLKSFGIALENYMDSFSDREPNTQGLAFLPMLYKYDPILVPYLIVIFPREALVLAAESPIVVIPQVGESGRVESLDIQLSEQMFSVPTVPMVTLFDQSASISEKDTSEILSPPSGESCLDIQVTVRDEAGNTSTSSSGISVNTEPDNSN